jgi:hypothetical protein
MRLRFAGAGLLLLLAAASNTAFGQSRSGGVTVIGVFDSSWPYPGDVRAPDIPIRLMGPTTQRVCGSVLDSARTDSAGRFKLRAPASASAQWRLCLGEGRTGSVNIPMFRFQGGTAASLRVYCRGHGPSGAPECLEVPAGAAMRWPGPP